MANEADRLAAMLGRFEKINERLKIAENITHQLPGASVNELRYMGRNLASILHLEKLPDAKRDAKIKSEGRNIESFLHDAELCLKRADHDLLDSVYSYVALDLHQKFHAYGQSLVCAHLGSNGYKTVIDCIEYVRLQIERSRGPERNGERSAIYEALYDGGYFDQLIKHYNDMDKAVPLLQAQYAEISRASRNAKFAIVFGAIASLASISSFFGYNFSDLSTDFGNVLMWAYATFASKFGCGNC